MKKVNSELPLSYITIRVTKSRIDKGLLAIPLSLVDYFPKNTNKIFLVNENGSIDAKKFTPYNSSSRECRIGGLKNLYDSYGVLGGEELVVQLLDDEKIRIIPEKWFQKKIKKNLNDFKNAKNNGEIEHHLSQISDITNLSQMEILRNEFIFRSKQKIEKRNFVKKDKTFVRESVPYAIKKMLLELYLGKCQISNFTFLTKKNIPYFELHHIDSEKGNHLKNIIVVSPNTHAQFTYANVEQFFDNEGWLRKVRFNGKELKVFQIIDEIKKDFKKEIHF